MAIRHLFSFCSMDNNFSKQVSIGKVAANVHKSVYFENRFCALDNYFCIVIKHQYTNMTNLFFGHNEKLVNMEFIISDGKLFCTMETLLLWTAFNYFPLDAMDIECPSCLLCTVDINCANCKLAKLKTIFYVAGLNR